jgi:hypothetical protein
MTLLVYGLILQIIFETILCIRHHNFVALVYGTTMKLVSNRKNSPKLHCPEDTAQCLIDQAKKLWCPVDKHLE